MTNTALALRPDQSQFDSYQRAVLRQMGIGDDVHNAELASYVHICQRTGLDPFSGQIHLIGRFDKRAGRVVYRPQTGIDGYRVIAQRTCERTSGSLGYGDTQWADADGKWTDVWLSGNPPKAAKATVYRNGQPFPAVAHYAEYVPTGKDGQPTGLWSRMAAGQLAKCAEALALRKAFPNDMAGIYTSEEMDQADSQTADYRMVNDPIRDAAGLMTSAQRVEHTAIRRMNEPPPGAVEKIPATPDDDQWYTSPPTQTPAPQAGPSVPDAHDEATPQPAAPAHRTQAGKPALDRLTAAFEQLDLDQVEQETVIGWLAAGEWTASTSQVKNVTSVLTDFLAAANGDRAEARTAMWEQYRQVTGSG